MPLLVQTMKVRYLILYAISALQRVYSRDGDGSVYQQWMINECKPSWFSLVHRATGEVLDGANSESNSMQRAELRA